MAGNRRQRLFAARKQRQRRGLLARRLGNDLEAALQRILRAFDHLEARFAAAEQMREQPFEVRVDGSKGFVQPCFAFAVELLNRTAKLQDALLKIVSLGREAFELLRHFGEIFVCLQIDAAKPFAITLDPGSSRRNHTGSWRTQRPVYIDRLPPCNATCPAGENIQGWLYHAEVGDYRAAWEAILADNPLPAIMGRACYHTCETACNRARIDEAVGIHAIERFLGDLAIREKWPAPPPAPSSGKRVLVVGGGASAVPDAAIVDAIRLLAETEGVFTEPAGGTTLAAAIDLVERGVIPRDESIVVCVTGNGYKTAEVMAGRLTEPVRLSRRFNDFEAWMEGRAAIA